VYFTQRRKKYAFFSDWCDWFGGSSNQFRGWKIAHRLDSYLEEKIRYRAERLSVTSKVLFDRALSIGIPADKVVHIPEGAATDYIMPRNRFDARRTIGLPSDSSIVLAVRNGDMCREVRIFRELLRQAPDAIFVMLGSSSNSAAELAERLGMSDRITWTGWVSDEHYPVYLASADVCFCPLEDNLNDRARWPAKILDFLAAGRSTVTNAVGEVERSFRGRDVAVLVGPEDEEFASAIATLLHESDRRSYLGERARHVMESEWDWRLRGPLIAAMVGGAG
jgi:glycosyltransferase involved in cell wall biosynthesis